MNCLWDLSLMIVGSSASAFRYNTIAHQPSIFVAVVCIRDHVHELSLQPQANPMYRSCPCQPAGVLGRTLRSQFCFLIGSLGHMNCLWDISVIESSASAFRSKIFAHSQPFSFVAIFCVRNLFQQQNLNSPANPMYRLCPSHPADTLGRTLRSHFCLSIGRCALELRPNTIAYHQPFSFVSVITSTS